jgi:hypothetical protein
LIPHDEHVTDCDAALEATASAVVKAAAEPMPGEARDAVRSRLLHAIGPTAVPLHVRLMRPAIAAACAAALLGGVSYAAAASGPGDLLYPLKRSVSDVVRHGSHAPASDPATTTAPAPRAAPETGRAGTPRVPAGVRVPPAVGAPGVSTTPSTAPRASARSAQPSMPPASRGKAQTNVAPGSSNGHSNGSNKGKGAGKSGSSHGTGARRSNGSHVPAKGAVRSRH